MKGKRILTSLLAVATGCACLFTTACADLDGLLGNGGGNGGNGGEGGDGHTHTSYGYEDVSGTQHRKYCTDPDCDYSILEDHNYTDATDTTCNDCSHVRTVDDGNGGGDGTGGGNGDDGGNGQVQDPTPSTDGILTYKYQGYESAAFEWSDTNAKSAKVEYRLSGSTTYTAIDNELIRQKDTTTARADVLGLKGNALYDFKVTSSANKYEEIKSVKIEEYDRSGYAHFNYTDGVGAYNDDGTPKSNAVIVYVTEKTKNTVTATIDGKTYTGIVKILNAATKTPLIVRVIGTVGAATWKEGAITYTKTSSNTDNENNLLPSAIVNKNGVPFEQREYNQSELKGTHNDLDTSVYSEIDGLSSKMKWDSSKKEFDSCWNDCEVKYVKNVTVEGVGEDARIFQWGFTFKNSSSIEVRNLTFEDYTEDACSFEASETSAANLNGFNSGNIWVHNNVFEEGVNYWDVCKEQDKADGDGSTDFKGLKNITISYNVYHDTHKTGLIGGGDTHTTANVTFHHNWYNGCRSRLPLARQANMHMYNNYYNATTDTSISLRAKAYAFVENCYFDSTSSNTKVIELQDNGENGKGSVKVINSTIASGRIVNNAGDDYIYNGTDRMATVTTANVFAPNFDTNSSLFYYKNGKSDVKEMLTAEQVKTTIPLVAGVSKRNNNMKGGDTLDPVVPEEPGTQTNPVPTLTVANAWPSSIGTEETTVTQTLTFGSGIFAIEPTGNNKNWKIYNEFLQCLGDGVITIDLTGYTGSAKLEIEARSPGAEDRYYTITGTGYSKQTNTFTTTVRTDTFTLECGQKYTLTCSNGLRFKSFKIYAA